MKQIFDNNTRILTGTKKIKTRFSAIALATAFFTLNGLMSEQSYANDSPSTSGITSFAFSSYLGTGFYTTSGQNVFVLQLPLEHEIKKKTSTEAGWILNLPITIGFINFSGIDFDSLPDVPQVNDVATVTFLPGIEFQYPVTPDWTLSPFVDYGFARDLNNTTNVLITGTGVKSYLDFHFDKNKLTLGNRVLYARERSKNSSNDSSYSLIETGLNYQINTNTLIANPLYLNFYYINLYYPNDLVFFEDAPNPILVGIEHEFGFTFSNIPDFLFFEKPQLGFGVRFGNGLNAYRIVFGAPF